jgi:hypothetical protein
MSESKSVKNQVLEKIKKGEIKMKPQWYFAIGSMALFLGTVFSTISAIFVFNLIFFLFRRHYGPMYQYRLNLILNNFPWWIILVGILGIILGIKLLKEYEFSYKKNFLLIIILYLLVIFLSAYLIDLFNLNRFWYQMGPLRKYYQKNRIWKNNNFYQKGPRWLRKF